MAFTHTLPDDVIKVIAGQINSSLNETDEGDEIGGAGGVGGTVGGGGGGADPPGPGDPPTNTPGTDGAPAASYTIAESFEVWTFAAGMTKEYDAGNRQLSTLVRPSGVWHHQLKIDGSPKGFARSKPLGPNPQDWSLREIFWSPLAKSIDEAIDWIDDKVPDGVEARMLSVPFQQTEAFWFVAAPNSTLAAEWNDKILTVVAPRSLAENLRPLELTDGATFLRLMAGPKPGEKLNRKQAG